MYSQYIILYSQYIILTILKHDTLCWMTTASIEKMDKRLYFVHNSSTIVPPIGTTNPFAFNCVCMTRIRCRNDILYLGVERCRILHFLFQIRGGGVDVLNYDHILRKRVV